jgi:hypothetical protein
VHCPLTQLCSLGQRVPQLPQLFESVRVFTQLPLQKVSCVFVQMQLPPAQVCPLPHDWPQAPQWLGSLWTLTQAPPQESWPAGQAQLPPLQLWPFGQVWPQFPQFCASLCRFTQAPPQAVRPDAQPPPAAPVPAVHCPFTQLCPAPQHTAPQPTRLVGQHRSLLHSLPAGQPEPGPRHWLRSSR